MRVLQVIPELDAGGAERTTVEIAEALNRKGGFSLVASRGGRLEGELRAAGGELARMQAQSKNPYVIWRNAARLARLAADEGMEIIHARSRAPAWSAYWASRRAGLPFITTYHGTYNARSGLKRWYNSVMAKGDRVIANSAFIQEHILTQHAIDPDRITVIPRGVDLDRFDLASVDGGRVSDFRSACGLAPYDSGPLILLPARLTRWKGQVIAIKALASLERQGAILALAGDAQGREAYVDELKALAGSLGVADRVRFPGHFRDMPAAYAAADLVIAPSVEPEAFGRTAAEAQAMRRLTIAADHGGAREVVLHGQTGWLAAPGDPAALAAAMEEALSLEKAERLALTDRAAARIRDCFSTASLQNATLRVYEEVLNSRHGR